MCIWPASAWVKTPQLQIRKMTRQRRRRWKKSRLYAIPFVVDAQAALAADKGEVVAQFQKKGFEVADEGIFQVALGYFIRAGREIRGPRG